jgi:hypothetical protein
VVSRPAEKPVTDQRDRRPVHTGTLSRQPSAMDLRHARASMLSYHIDAVSPRQHQMPASQIRLTSRDGHSVLAEV